MIRKTLAALIVFTICCSSIATAEVPLLINYQGRLIDGTNLVNGTVSLIVRLYDRPAGGSALFGDSNQVDVVDGLYSTLIGDDTLLGDFEGALHSTQVWIEVEVDGTVLAPREQMMAVAYAVMADGVTTGAITSAMLADGAVGSAQLANNAVQSNHIAIGAVQAQHIAIGAVDTPQLANGAVSAIKIDSNSVGRTQLVRAYESDRYNMDILARTNVHDFSRAEAETNVIFDLAFGTTPIITLGVSTTSRQFAAEHGAAVMGKDETGFSFSVEFSPEPAIVRAVGVGQDDFPCLAKVQGRPAVIMVDQASNTLLYTRAQDPLGLEWGEVVVVATDVDTPYCYPTMTVVAGYPAVCYRDTNEWLRYVRAEDTLGMGWGEPVFVDTDNDVGVENHMLEVNGRPAVAYKNNDIDDLMYAYSSTAAGTNASDWNLVTVDPDQNPGDELSMAIIDGNPAIAYYENDSNDLYYVRALNVQGSVWGTPICIVPDDNSGVGVSLAEVNGAPAVAFRWYVHTKTNMVFFYRANDSVGSSWGFLAYVDTNAANASICQLGMFDGYPAVAYYGNESDDLIFVTSPLTNGATMFGSYWNTPILIATNGETGRFPSMTEILSTPAIVYNNQEEGRYEFIRSGNPPANSWVEWIAIEP